jgi:outer membrane beta-barrel protein
MIEKVLAGFVAALILLVGNSGWCDSQTDEETVYAIQNRVFHRNHQLDLSIGYIADDDFFHVYPVSLGYTFHFGDNWSWEVMRFGYNYNDAKDLKQTLEDDFGAQPERFPEQIYMYHSHLVFKPLYGKHAVLNRGIVNNEIYLFAGAGMVHYEWDYSTGETDTEDAPSISFGTGMRFFLSKHFCLNIEIRDLVNLREDDTENNIYFGAGVGYRFNLAPRKVEQDPTVKKLKKILEEE